MPSYGCRFPAMIADWRSKWQVGSLGETAADFPFGFVNLAPWINPNNAPAGIRWAQSAGYGYVPNPAMPNVFSSISIDLTDNTGSRNTPSVEPFCSAAKSDQSAKTGSGQTWGKLREKAFCAGPFGSVHIRDKTSVGERLAAAGVGLAYGDSSSYWQGPTVLSAALKGAEVVITFNNTGEQGLEVRKQAPTDTAFELCTATSAATLASSCNLTMAGHGPVGGGWEKAKVVSSTATTVTVAGGKAAAAEAGEGAVLVRYGWAAVPFQYKAALIYAKAEAMPAGPFVKKVL